MCLLLILLVFARAPLTPGTWQDALYGSDISLAKVSASWIWQLRFEMSVAAAGIWKAVLFRRPDAQFVVHALDALDLLGKLGRFRLALVCVYAAFNSNHAFFDRDI